MAKRLPDHWKNTYCAFIAEGYTRTDAASATGVAVGTVDRHQSEDPEFRELYLAAREVVRDKVRNRIWAMGMQQGSSDVDAATTRWALDHLIKWNLPEARETQTLELTTPEPLQIEGGRRPVSLTDVIELAHSLGVGLGAGLRAGATDGTLPAAANLRPSLSAAAIEPAAVPVAPD